MITSFNVDLPWGKTLLSNHDYQKPHVMILLEVMVPKYPNLYYKAVFFFFIFFFSKIFLQSQTRRKIHFGGCEALPRKESLLLVFGNHDYQVMCFFPQGKIDVGEGNHN